MLCLEKGRVRDVNGGYRYASGFSYRALRTHIQLTHVGYPRNPLLPLSNTFINFSPHTPNSYMHSTLAPRSCDNTFKGN